MSKTKNIVPLFRWAKANGEATIVDRILMKNALLILKSGLKLTREKIETNELIEVNKDLYEMIKKSAQELVGVSYEERLHV